MARQIQKKTYFVYVVLLVGFWRAVTYSILWSGKNILLENQNRTKKSLAV